MSDADIEKVRAENAELNRLFDLHWRNSMRAVERWRAAHPGNDLVIPDHTDLLVWLMEELDTLRIASDVLIMAFEKRAGDLMGQMAEAQININAYDVQLGIAAEQLAELTSALNRAKELMLRARADLAQMTTYRNNCVDDLDRVERKLEEWEESTLAHPQCHLILKTLREVLIAGGPVR